MRSFILVLLFVWANFSVVYASDVIRIVADDWCPYTCDAKGNDKGVLIDMVEHIFLQHGIKVEYYNNIWNLAVEDARNGYAHAVAGTSKIGMKDFVFPDVQQANTISYFYTSPNVLWKYRGGGSFKKVTLGAIDGYSYGDLIDEYLSNNADDLSKVVLVKNAPNAIDTLYRSMLKGKIDTFVEDPIVLEYYLSRMQSSVHPKISGLADSGMQEDDKIYIAFSSSQESSERYAKILAEGIMKMKKDNSIKPIIERYGLTYWNW